MGSNKNRPRKRANKITKIKQVKQVKQYNKKAIEAGDKTCQIDEIESLVNKLPFSSVSNKQLQNMGLIPLKRNVNQTLTIPLKFPTNLFSKFMKIINTNKLNNAGKTNKSGQQLDNKYITLVSIQNYIQQPNQETKQCSSQFPSFQVNQIPMQNSTSQMGLYLSETNFKAENVSPQILKLQELVAEPKGNIKRTLLKDNCRKQPNQPIPPPKNETQHINQHTNKISDTNVTKSLSCEPLNSPNTPKRQQTISTPKTVQIIKLDSCNMCNKPTYIRQRIQIGSNNLHHSTWNKHHEPYVCDNCNKNTNCEHSEESKSKTLQTRKDNNISESVVNSILKESAIELKVNQKRSLLINECCKKPTQPISPPKNMTQHLSKPTNEIIDPKKIMSLPYEPLNSLNTPSRQPTTSTPQTVQIVNLQSCVICKKTAYIPERIQIGDGIFHLKCFKCDQCFKNLYYDTWNKNGELYLCDDCNKMSNCDHSEENNSKTRQTKIIYLD